jgi:hypothetical protein
MTGYAVGDKVTVSFMGDTVWTVAEDRRYGPHKLITDQPSGGWATLVVSGAHVSRVRMQEPTELGAVVMTDKGRAVRYTEGAFRWYLADSAAGAKSWGELWNPRPVGDQ